MATLAQAHIKAQADLRELTVRGVSRAWEGLPAYNEADVSPFVGQVVPFVEAAQRRSSALTNAFVARAIGRRPYPIRTARTYGAAVRNGTPPTEVYRRPFVTVWTALKAGKDFDAAVNAGLARLTGTAAMDVQLASRATYREVQRVEPRIRGYERVPDGGACDYCLAIAGAFVKSADAMPLHDRCGCGLDPVLSDVSTTPVPDDVAVHEHGELGAVLGDPSHNFTTL